MAGDRRASTCLAAGAGEVEERAALAATLAETISGRSPLIVVSSEDQRAVSVSAEVVWDCSEERQRRSYRPVRSPPSRADQICKKSSYRWSDSRQCAGDIVLKEMRDVGLEGLARIIKEIRARRNCECHSQQCDRTGEESGC